MVTHVITAQHHYHVRLTVFLITLPLSLPLYIDVARRGCGGSILLLPSYHPWWECVYSVHRYHYYHHTIIRSDTAEISIYTRGEMPCVCWQITARIMNTFKCLWSYFLFVYNPLHILNSSETFHRLMTLASFYIITPENNMTSTIAMIRAKQ